MIKKNLKFNTGPEQQKYLEKKKKKKKKKKNFSFQFFYSKDPLIILFTKRRTDISNSFSNNFFK